MPAACAHHPDVTAELRCRFCDVEICRACSEPRRIGGRAIAVCRRCGGRCEELHAPAGPVERARGPTFRQDVPGAFRCPFHKTGYIEIIGGTLLLLLLDLGSTGGVLFVGFMIAAAASVGGYICSFLLQVIAQSGFGRDDVSPWPDPSRFWSDIIQPFWLMLCASFVCFAPAWFARDSLAFWPLVLVGAVLHPMCVFRIALLDSAAALAPPGIVVAIARTASDYVLVVAAWLVLPFLRSLIDAVAADRLQLTDLGNPSPFQVALLLLANAGFLYLLLVECRVLGLFYRHNADRLGWLE